MQPVIVAMIVMESAVLGVSVVSGIVVVTVDKLPMVPNPVAGIALPSPLLVHGDGMDIVLVSGLMEVEVSLLYMLPLVPSLKV